MYKTRLKQETRKPIQSGEEEDEDEEEEEEGDENEESDSNIAGSKIYPWMRKSHTGNPQYGKYSSNDSNDI